MKRGSLGLTLDMYYSKRSQCHQPNLNLLMLHFPKFTPLEMSAISG